MPKGTIIDRRYGRNLPESVSINIVSVAIAYVVIIVLFFTWPFILVANRIIFGKWLSDGSDPRSANEINADLLKKTLDS